MSLGDELKAVQQSWVPQRRRYPRLEELALAAAEDEAVRRLALRALIDLSRDRANRCEGVRSGDMANCRCGRGWRDGGA